MALLNTELVVLQRLCLILETWPFLNCELAQSRRKQTVKQQLQTWTWSYMCNILILRLVYRSGTWTQCSPAWSAWCLLWDLTGSPVKWTRWKLRQNTFVCFLQSCRTVTVWVLKSSWRSPNNNCPLLLLKDSTVTYFERLIGVVFHFSAWWQQDWFPKECNHLWSNWRLQRWPMESGWCKCFSVVQMGSLTVCSSCKGVQINSHDFIGKTTLPVNFGHFWFNGFTLFYYFVHCRFILMPSKLWRNTSGVM